MKNARLWVGSIIMGIAGIGVFGFFILASLIISSTCDVQEWAKFYVFLSGSVFGSMIALAIVLGLGWLFDIPADRKDEPND